MKPRFYADPDLRALDVRLTALEELVSSPPVVAGRMDPVTLADALRPGGVIRYKDDPVTAEVATELKPDAYAIKHLNYGWYEVVDSEGLPIHKGKLRKPQALDLMAEKGA